MRSRRTLRRSLLAASAIAFAATMPASAAPSNPAAAPTEIVVPVVHAGDEAAPGVGVAVKLGLAAAATAALAGLVRAIGAGRILGWLRTHSRPPGKPRAPLSRFPSRRRGRLAGRRRRLCVLLWRWPASASSHFPASAFSISNGRADSLSAAHLSYSSGWRRAGPSASTLRSASDRRVGTPRPATRCQADAKSDFVPARSRGKMATPKWKPCQCGKSRKLLIIRSVSAAASMPLTLPATAI